MSCVDMACVLRACMLTTGVIPTCIHEDVYLGDVQRERAALSPCALEDVPRQRFQTIDHPQECGVENVWHPTAAEMIL